MSALKYFVAAIGLAVPIMFASAPAGAATARQQALQGQGIATTSKGVPEGYTGGAYEPQVERPDGYQDGYPRRRFRHHRRYEVY